MEQMIVNWLSESHHDLLCEIKRKKREPAFIFTYGKWEIILSASVKKKNMITFLTKGMVDVGDYLRLSKLKNKKK